MPDPRHEPETLLANVLAEVRSATAVLDQRDTSTRARLNSLENSINDLMRRAGRPSGGNGLGETDERAQAIGLLQQRFYNRQTKHDGTMVEPSFSSEEINEAKTAIRGLHTLLHATSIDQLPLDQRKALSAFSFGSSGFLLAPEMSNEILSCLVDIGDITALMRNISISGSSIKFIVDNELWDVAAWACEASCFANNPTKQIGDGLGELELKPESLRYIVCATKELLEDSGVAIEPWLFSKASRAFRVQISAAVINGDGFGKPMGILNPAAGIPIVETAPASPAGAFSWQDLILMRWQLPMNYQDGGSYIMNPKTWGLCSTMSDANGRPIMIANPTEGAPFLLGGAPVVINALMPDVAPGATPVAFGNWQQAYTIVNRRGVTVQNDPFSAGWCTLFKFDARIGGGVVCPGAARLLRIR